jgi:hypothetical protein
MTHAELTTCLTVFEKIACKLGGTETAMHETAMHPATEIPMDK